jgi:hypothetical protein
VPTKRTWRERQSVSFPTAYEAYELLTGEIICPVRGYDGYGDGWGTDLHRFIGDRMRSDWMTHRDELLEFHVGIRPELPNERPWLPCGGAPGTRPWAWWALEEHPPINADEYEHEHRYLDRTGQWQRDERALFEAAEKSRGGR